MQTTTVEFFQKDGALETIMAASAQFERDNPTRRVVDANFESASPGRPGEGRWVTIVIEHTAK